MKTALLLIATGENYRRYASALLASAEQYLFPHDSLLWTDEPTNLKATRIFQKAAAGFPSETLYRYHTFLTELALLRQYDFLLYCDADMLFVAPVTKEEVVSDGITATMHPGFVGLSGTPETNPRSTAYCPNIRTYFCGGFNGGTSTAFLQMAKVIKQAIDQDTSNGIKAIWNDESHLNKYLYDHHPTRTLTPAFCYPQREYEQSTGEDFYGNIWKQAGYQNILPKLIALKKGSR